MFSCLCNNDNEMETISTTFLLCKVHVQILRIEATTHETLLRYNYSCKPPFLVILLQCPIVCRFPGYAKSLLQTFPSKYNLVHLTTKMKQC